MEAGSKPVSYTDYSVDSVVVAREGDRDSNTGNSGVQKLGPGNSASLEFGTFERKRISRPALRLGDHNSRCSLPLRVFQIRSWFGISRLSIWSSLVWFETLAHSRRALS